MGYQKAMNFSNNYSRKSYIQPVLGMPFEEGEKVLSYSSIAESSATGYNIRATNEINTPFIQITDEFASEDEAIDYMRDNDVESKYKYVRIYSTEGMVISGW